jgi:GrpB-like predicted nucleotidyltransferase (UPF0157 family)
MSKSLGELYPVFIVPYDPAWPEWYEDEKACLYAILGEGLILRMEHMGSTAVPGMPAKPTVDILVQIPEEKQDHAFFRHLLEPHGYIYMQEQRHIMFVKGYGPGGLEKRSFHIHMGTGDDDSLWDRLCFRDYLREHPGKAAAYARLKERLSMRFRNDREAYTRAKGEFIRTITDLGKKGHVLS